MSKVDDYDATQTRLMAQQITSKPGFQELVEYIGEETNMNELAMFNVALKLNLIKNTKAAQVYKAMMVEQGKAYFMTKRSSELTILGLILGDTSKRLRSDAAKYGLKPKPDPVP